MNKYKVSFLILLIINVIVIFFFMFRNYIDQSYNKNIKEGKMENYSYMLDNETPIGGYVSDGKLAYKIAKSILEDTYIKPGIGYTYEVMYDKKNDVWIVHSANLFNGSAYIVINKDDGRIIKAWEAKK